jgi:hypothetical protein
VTLPSAVSCPSVSSVVSCEQTTLLSLIIVLEAVAAGALPPPPPPCAGINICVFCPFVSIVCSAQIVCLCVEKGFCLCVEKGLYVCRGSTQPRAHTHTHTMCDQFGSFFTSINASDDYIPFPDNLP